MLGARDNSWRAITASVRGASHLRTGAPNQDSVGVSPATREGPPLILAVSDGHGSAKCVRSDVGSRLAVAVALAALEEFLAQVLSEGSDPSSIHRLAEQRLPEAIERAWKARVAEHFLQAPWTDGELHKIQESASEVARRQIEERPVIAYGCTLLAALIESSFAICLQIGDGDMLAVTERGEVGGLIPRDPRHFANETTSLSSDESWRNFQLRFQQFAGTPPALLLLCTDGYTNAFRGHADFRDAAREFVEALRDDGPEVVGGYLEELLTDASRRGSGDDVTLGLLFRANANVAEWPDWRPKEPATAGPPVAAPPPSLADQVAPAVDGPPPAENPFAAPLAPATELPPP